MSAASDRVDRWVGIYMRFWRWVAVFACARLNARLWPEQHIYVVTQTGTPSEAQTLEDPTTTRRAEESGSHG